MLTSCLHTHICIGTDTTHTEAYNSRKSCGDREIAQPLIALPASSRGLKFNYQNPHQQLTMPETQAPEDVTSSSGTAHEVHVYIHTHIYRERETETLSVKKDLLKAQVARELLTESQLTEFKSI